MVWRPRLRREAGGRTGPWGRGAAMTHPIVLGYDGSACSAAALDETIELARDTSGAEVVLVYCHEPPPGLSCALDPGCAAAKELRDYERRVEAEVEPMLRHAADRVRAAGIQTEVLLMWDDPRARARGRGARARLARHRRGLARRGADRRGDRPAHAVRAPPPRRRAGARGAAPALTAAALLRLAREPADGVHRRPPAPLQLPGAGLGCRRERRAGAPQRGHLLLARPTRRSRDRRARRRRTPSPRAAPRG